MVIHRPMIGRGDLLRCFSQCPEAEEVAARLCGYKARQPVLDERRVGEAPAAPPAQRTPVIEPAAVRSGAGVPASFPLLVASRYQPLEEQPAPRPEDVAWLAEEALREEEIRSAPVAPDPAPLVSWSRLWPFLHRALGCYRAGHRLDLGRLIRRLARLEPVRAVPRVPMLAWSPRAWLLIDRRSQLAAFRNDFDLLVRRLRRQRGRAGLHCARVEAPCHVPAKAETKVLVLSDLGCLDQDSGLRDAWRAFGARWKRLRSRPIALMPCPRSRWDRDLCRYWDCHVWDRGQRLRHPPKPPKGGEWEACDDQSDRVERLLSLVSPAIRVEPALLRGARLLLPPEEADVGTEFDAWHHQDAARTPEAMALRPAAAIRRREAFSRCSATTQRAMVQLIRHVHRHWSISFFARETITLHEHGAPVPKADVESAWRVLRRFNKTMLEIYVDDPARANRMRLFEWQQSDYARSSPAARAAPEAAVAWALARAWGGEQAAIVPEDIAHAVVEETQQLLLAAHFERSAWQLSRAGAGLVLEKCSAGSLAGSCLAAIPAASPRFDLLRSDRDGERARVNLLPRSGNSPVQLVVGDSRRIDVRSDLGELELTALEPPPWASRFGWDRYGLFADFELGGVAFPLRWIPPGEFEMGSPEDEPGRWDAEGPRHRVTIGRGFWLAKTPVTQAQYAAVTGQRPSQFKNAGELAPVEQVSWEDCQAFCGQLRSAVAALTRESDDPLVFRLPSEAEWEYACRAGTSTALSTGPLTIVGERNGPELDPIAWYGGNSGVEYEGGFDSSDWPEKQRDHSRAGTHPVGLKAPNAWGLHDMLGNVWEWCEDHWHGSYQDAPTDGRAWVEDAAAGSRRVDRGGGWAGLARFCRCADRGYWRPGGRYDILGFRFVLAASFNEDSRPFP